MSRKRRQSRQKRQHEQRRTHALSRSGLSRRSFLGGAGAMIALPFLSSLGFRSRHVARAATPESPVRSVFFYVPNGIHMADWTPTTFGPGYELPSILAPLANVKDSVSVLSGLDNAPCKPDGAGDHAAGTGGFLTCTHVRKTDGDDILNGISVDQVMAQTYGAETALSSLQLGLESGDSVGDCDSGYSCAYARNISWAGPQTPLPKIVNPRLVFDRLFQGADATLTADEVFRRTTLRKSVLDYVVDDAKALQTRLSASDKEKVDEYLTGVRELEKLIELGQNTTCSPPDYPDQQMDLTARAIAMNQLTTIALQCDLTRTVSFMFGNAGSSRNYSWLDPTISETHHEVSHHNNNPENFRMLSAINRYEVQIFADLLERFSEVADGTSTLLDNSQVFFSSEIADGNSHSHADMPILLAGGACGAIRTGEHIDLTGGKVSDLFITMLGAAGIERATFGDDGTGPIPELLL